MIVGRTTEEQQVEGPKKREVGSEIGAVFNFNIVTQVGTCEGIYKDRTGNECDKAGKLV